MKVFVVVQHYDRGSDEVAVEGVFSTERAAMTHVLEEFTGWEWTDDDIRPGFYANPDDPETSDYVFVVEQEVM